MIDHPEKNDSRLRQEAEKRLAERFPEGEETQSRTEHELRVYQVELEMQNQQLRETQIELQQALERYSNLYHQSPVGYLSLDGKGRICELNESFAAMLARPPSELRGTHLVHYLTPDSAAVLRQRLPAFFKNPVNKILQLSIATRGTELLHIEIQGRRLQTSSLLICNVIDRTVQYRMQEQLKAEREHLEQERQNLQTIFNAAQISMLLIDKNGRVTRVNDQAMQMVMKNTGDVLQRRPGDAVCCIHAVSSLDGCGQSQACSTCAVIKSLEYVKKTRQRAVDVDVEKTLVVDGRKKRFYFSLSAVPLVLAGSPCILLSLSDITARKDVEEALRRKSSEIEQFVYIVTHDLKSPIITVKTFLDMLRQDIAEDNRVRVEKDLAFIAGAADKMSQLLDALVQYSRIGKESVEVKPLDFSPFVEGCLGVLAGTIHERGVKVEVAPLAMTLTGDALQLGQLWQNLVENAIKYMGDQPAPRIEIGVEEQDKATVFFVRDNGMGIGPADQQRIFNLFSQLDPASGGSGLGLALVKKIVELYQGRIWVESAGAGQGSCFYFTLPLALAPPAQQRQSA